MKNLKYAAMLGLFFAVGCLDSLDVVNENDADKGNVVVTPGDVANLIGGAYLSYWLASEDWYAANGLSVAADELTRRVMVVERCQGLCLRQVYEHGDDAAGSVCVGRERGDIDPSTQQRIFVPGPATHPGAEPIVILQLRGEVAVEEFRVPL